MKKKTVLFHQDNADGQIEWITLSIAAPDLASSDYYVFADIKRILTGNRLVSNEEVFDETEPTYFVAKDESFYKKIIEMLEKRWNECY